MKRRDINMLTVKDFFQLFEDTLFKEYYLIEDLEKIQEKEKEDAQELMEFELDKFGKWIYGISNYGRKKGSYIFIIQKEIDGKIFRAEKVYNTLEDIKKDRELMKMEVKKVEEFSLEGRHKISSTGTSWPANEASITIVVM